MSMSRRNQEDPFPLDESTCAAAARGGHLEVLKWLRSQDDPCPWDEETCYCAALGGHLEVLHWLRSQEDPCPWDESICGTAFCDWLCLNPIRRENMLSALRADDPGRRDALTRTARNLLAVGVERTMRGLRPDSLRRLCLNPISSESMLHLGLGTIDDQGRFVLH